MLNLPNGVRTLRYWTSVQHDIREYAGQIDRGAMLSELRGFRGDIDAILAVLERDGVVALPNYWSADKCAGARDEIERLMGEFPEVVQKFSGGADRRMFGVETKSPALAEFHADPFLRGIGEQLGGFGLYNFATLGARIDATSENNGSGDGWHRDAHGYQFKSIIYLSDVIEENGPFEYLPGSHKRWRATFEAAFGGLPPAPNSRYEAASIEAMRARFGLAVNSFIGPAGTLLLVNTAGIHRGRPLRSGTRYALTNYFYYPHQIDESRIQNFPTMLPGTAERVRADLLAS
jgi:hypothetical protein